MSDKRVATEFELTTYGELDSKDWSCDLTISTDKEFVKEPSESEIYLGITFTNLSKHELLMLRKEIDNLFPDGNRITDYEDLSNFW